MIADEIITVRYVAKYLGISQSKVVSYIDSGLLKPDFILPSKDNNVVMRRFRQSTLDSFKRDYLNVKESK